MNFIEKYGRIIYKALAIAGVVILIYVTVKYLLSFMAPFIIAAIISSINEPLVRLLERKARMPRKAASAVSLIITLSVLGFLVTIGIIKIYDELVALQHNISNYIDGASDQIQSYVRRATEYYNTLPRGVVDAVEGNLKTLAPKLEGVLTSFVTYLINTLSSLPRMAVFIIVTLMSSYFFSSDRREIRDFLYRQVPDAWKGNIVGIKTDTFAAFFGYLKAVGILLGITFLEVSVGLVIIGSDYALVMGLIVAVADALPVVGTGIVLIPWMIWNLIVGNMHMVWGLAIIYVLGIIIRQFLEPKIVGDQIGLHPLVTLIAIYIGLQFFGLLGMILGPITIIILKSLQSSGLLKIWKE